MPASKLGPLAGRTLGGSSSSAASGKGSPRRSPSASGAGVGAGAGSGHSATSSSFASGPVSSPSSSKSHGFGGATDGKRSDSVDAASGSHPSQQRHHPYLLPREQETSTHRRLRSLLLDAHRLRSTWRDEVDEAGEVVARFVGVVAELEDELRAEEERLRESSKRRRGLSKSSIQVQGIEMAGNEDGAGHAAVVVESLRELQTVHVDLTKALQRMTRCVDAMVKVKDDLHELERTVAGAAWSDVAWSARVTIEDLVESANDLTLQVQMQNAQLVKSVQMLYEQGSPLGSLESYCKAANSADTEGGTGADDVSPEPRLSKSPYDPQKSSSTRKDVLLQWRDLPLVEHTGPRSFEWWAEVCKAEVGRWKETG